MLDNVEKDWTTALLTEMRRFNPGGYDPILAQHPEAVLGCDAQGVTPLMQAAATHDWLVQKIINCGASAMATDMLGRSATHYAAASGCGHGWNVIKRLRDAGGDINAKDSSKRTPLHYATFWNNLSALEALVGAGADVMAVDAYGETPLQMAQRLKLGAVFFAALGRGPVPFKAGELTPGFNKASAAETGTSAKIITLKDYARLRALRGPHK
jgi:hypothetical protein